MLRVIVVAAIMLVASDASAAPRRYAGSFRACPEVDGLQPGQRDDARVVPVCREKEAKLYREAFEKDEPVIELVTMGIGDLIWERHGHIALCIRFKGDPIAQRPGFRRAAQGQYKDDAAWFKALIDAKVDVCSNYGIGSFHEPVSMAWGFFRGTNSFWAGPQTTEELKQIYVGRDRTVWAQPIPLDSAQKQEVIAKLLFDAEEANKYYAYDHFWDNCTTRVRDILDKATKGALSGMTNETDGRTYRDLAREGFYGMRGPLLITDIAMGRVTDRVPSYWERMFLPDYLREAVQAKWDIQPVVLYQRQGEPPPTETPSGRVLFAFIALLFTLPVVLTRWLGRFERSALAFAVIPYFLLGTILLFLAIISPLTYVMWNESCLVFFPADIALLFLRPERRRAYARGRVIMLGVLAVAMILGIFHQPLLGALIWPLIPNAVVGFWRPEWSRVRAK